MGNQRTRVREGWLIATAADRRRTARECGCASPVPGQLFGHFSGQAGDAADDEEQAAEDRWKPHVVQHRRERAVHVDGQRLDGLPHDSLEGFHEGDAVSRQAVLPREIEQDRRARVSAVHAVTEAGHSSARRPRFRRDQARAFGDGDRLPCRTLDAGGNHLHAAHARAAVLVSHGQDAGGDGGGHRLTVARQRQPSGRAGRRARAMVGHAREDRVQHRAFPGRRQTACMQQVDCVREGPFRHQGRDVVATNPDFAVPSFNDACAPRFHKGSSSHA